LRSALILSPKLKDIIVTFKLPELALKRTMIMVGWKRHGVYFSMPISSHLLLLNFHNHHHSKCFLKKNFSYLPRFNYLKMVSNCPLGKKTQLISQRFL
jgi:hypothetical protein